MENFDHKAYRHNLAKDLTDIHKEDPKKAGVVSDALKGTENYQKAKELHEGDKERMFLDNLNSLVKTAKNYSGTYNLNIPILRGMGHKVDIDIEKILNDTKDQRYITGLTLEPVETNQGIIAIGDNLEAKNIQEVMAGAKHSNLNEIRLNVNDIKRFNKSLESFDKNNLKSEDDTSLKFVAKSLVKQIQEQYDLESGTEDRLLNLFLGMKEFVENYKRLGLEDSAKQFESYLDASRAGYMREYIMAEVNHLLPVELSTRSDWDGYGSRKRVYTNTPYTWQEDIQVLSSSIFEEAPFLEGEKKDENGRYRYINDFRDKWKKTFETLDALKNNPKAKEFYIEIKDYLKKCLEFIEKNGLGSDGSWKEMERTYPMLAAEMKKIKQELEQH